ncbi:MAG: hypothetical protein ACM33T_15170 [Solirubrobacterales bacterium]
MLCVDGDAVEVLHAGCFADRHAEERIQAWADTCPALVNGGYPLLSLGTEIITRHGHAIDNLFIDGTGVLVAVEMKRGRTPRDVVAQVLDYAAHLSRLEWPEVDALCRKRHGLALDEAFRRTFARPLGEGGKPGHRLAILAERYDPRTLDAARYLIDGGLPLVLLQFTYVPVGERAVLDVRAALGTMPETNPIDDFVGDVMKTWTLDQIAKLPQERRAAMYDNALRVGGPEGQALAKLIEESGLPYRNPTCPSDNDPIMRRIEEVVFSGEGRKAAIEAAAQGLPAMAGIDPLLQQALGKDYGKHNLTTATAGDRVANLMRQMGYREAGSRSLPSGCVAKSAMLWVMP